MDKAAYRIEPINLSTEGISEIRQLLNLVFPQAAHFTDNYLDWEYNKNPAGNAVGFNAYQEMELAGHYVALPLKARLFNRECRGLLSLNTATHPNHQGKGLFTKLAERTYAKAREQGYEFIIGVANANSTHGFVSKLGFQLVGPLSAKIGLKKVTLQNSSRADFERIWDESLLNWRLSNPSARYGWAPAHNGCLDLLASAQHGFKVLLGQFENHIVPKNHLTRTRAIPKVWLGINGQTKWLRHLYFEIPDRLKPSPLNCIFKDLTGKSRTLDLKKVLFSAIDFDAF